MRTDEKALVDRLRMLAGLEDPDAVREELEGTRAEDIAEAFVRLDLDEGLHLLQLLDPETAAYVLVELPTETARQFVNGLPDTTIAHYLDILPMDDALDLREELDPARFESLLHVIPDEDAEEIRRLLSYPEGSVGQLLTEEYVSVAPEDTMAMVLEHIREAPDDFETVNYIYVLSQDGHLLGVLTLRRVIRANPNAVARDVMNDDPISAVATMPEEDVARLLARYGFSALPVLDERGRMLGIVTADDAQDILQEAETEDVLKLGAVSGDAEPYLSLGFVQLVRRRLPWLMILFVAEFLTGYVLRFYTNQSASAGRTVLAQLMLFVPLLIGAGGNSGSQVTTTITRALALGEVALRDWFTVLRRELVVAFAIGCILGSIGFVRALMWGSDWHISVVVGTALPVIVMWSATVASLLPLVAKRLGFDPAVLSAPFITTFVDATGMVIFFEIAGRIVKF